MTRRLLLLWLRRHARRRLDGIAVLGLDRLRRAADAGPVVLVSNHVGWWDGPVARLVDAHVGLDTRTLVDAATVTRLPFLRWFGAVPVTGGGAALRDTARWLDRPRRAVWVYAQGRHHPPGLRPLGLRPGYRLFSRHAAVVPVAIDYRWYTRPVPRAVLAFGDPVLPGDAESAVEGLLERVWTTDPPPLLAAPGGGADRALPARLLAWIAG